MVTHFIGKCGDFKRSVQVCLWMMDCPNSTQGIHFMKEVKCQYSADFSGKAVKTWDICRSNSIVGNVTMHRCIPFHPLLPSLSVQGVWGLFLPESGIF